VCLAGYGANFTDPGSMEIGGTASFTSLNQSGTTSTIWSIAPVVNFFPAQYFMLGPALSFNMTYVSGFNYLTDFGFGFNTGLMYPINGANIVPYLTSGIQATWEGGEVDGYSPPTSFLWAIPINVGIKVPIQKHISFNIGPSFTLYTSSSAKVFLQSPIMISCGFTGLIF